MLPKQKVMQGMLYLRGWLTGLWPAIQRLTPLQRRGLLVITLAILLIGLSVWLGGTSDQSVHAPPPALTADSNTLRFPADAPQLSYLKIMTADIEPVPVVEPFSGQITYDEDRTVRVFSPVSGRVLRGLVQVGDQVHVGQSLVLLDAPDYADLQKSSFQLKTSTLAYERAKALFEADVISRKALEGAGNDFQQAKAEAARANARLRNLAPVAEGVALKTPLSGTVMIRRFSPGVEVSPAGDTPLLVVSDPSKLWVMAELPEQSLGKLKVGQTVSIRVDAYPDRSFVGRVRSVADVLNPDTRRVVVRCSVDNPEHLLKPEMYAQVVPVDSTQHLPRVSNAALVTEGIKTFLFVETAPGVLEKRKVELAFRGHEFSYVSQGLSGGERVVSAGALLLNAELVGN